MTAGATTEVRQQLETVLRDTADRGALLRALSELVQQRAFRDLAPTWAPALYARDAVFFESFLVRHLDHTDVIADLLRCAEADRHDSLFQGLYPKIATEERWDAELRALAAAPQDDETVLRAVRRRTFRGMWFGLHEETALALYRRDPELFGPFIAARVRHLWRGGQRQFARLRAEVRARGDQALALALFRALADSDEWSAEVRNLLAQRIPPDQIVDALHERHPARLWELDPGVLVEVLQRYGAAVLPYLEEHLPWVLHRIGDRLLDTARRLGDESLYWRLFFRVADAPRWNNQLRDLLKQPLRADALLIAIQRRTPQENQWQRWRLAPDVARALYKRAPQALRPFLEQFVFEADDQLFAMAERAGDNELLDFLTFRALRQLSPLVWRAYPPERGWGQRRPDAAARRELEKHSAPLIARLNRLAADSPVRYVRHAANILSYVAAFEVWDFRRDRRHHPVFAYLSDRHHDAWLAAPTALRELLESPNIFIQIIGLEMLAGGGPDAAARVVENLTYLRALLLGRARIGTKKLVLTCLEQAAHEGPAFAAAVLPLLDEAIDVRGRRAVDVRAMVSYVRLQHALRTTATG
jgi:hypothetical protein